MVLGLLIASRGTWSSLDGFVECSPCVVVPRTHREVVPDCVGDSASQAQRRIYRLDAVEIERCR